MEILANNCNDKSLSTKKINTFVQVFEDELCYRGYRDRYDTDLDRDR